MSDLETMAGEQPEPAPKLDAYRRDKVFKIARKLNKCFMLETAKQDDQWLVIAVFKINATVYEIVHVLDENTPAEHAELFKEGMANALDEYNKQNRIITTIH